MPPRVDRERRDAAMARLRELQDSGDLTTARVRLVASGLQIAARTVWRWLQAGDDPIPTLGRPRYELSQTDREAFAHYRRNVAAVDRARASVASGAELAGGVPEFLRQG